MSILGRLFAVALVATPLLFAGAAKSAVINNVGNLQTTISTGNTLGDDNNVFLVKENDDEFVGHLGGQNTGLLVTFLADVDLIVKDGFAAGVTPLAGEFNTLTLAIAAGYTFDSLTFNVDGPSAFTITASNGGSSAVTNVANNENQFTTIATLGPGLTWVTIHSDEGFDSFKQFEINISAAVPEPSTWAMMVLGFAGVGFMAYRRTRKNDGLALPAA
jgi:PEP-CTERM motif